MCAYKTYAYMYICTYKYIKHMCFIYIYMHIYELVVSSALGTHGVLLSFYTWWESQDPRSWRIEHNVSWNSTEINVKSCTQEQKKSRSKIKMGEVWLDNSYFKKKRFACYSGLQTQWESVLALW